MGTKEKKSRWKAKIHDYILIILILVLVFLFYSLISPLENLRVDTLTYATFIMAIAIWFTMIISFIPISQNQNMLRINLQTLEEMRRSRPKPLVVANIENAPTGIGFNLVVKNKGRESARDIKVRYCRGEIQNMRPGVVYDETQLVDSPWIETEVMPLGPGENQKFDFGHTIDPRIWYFKFEVTYSDGVESYKEAYRIDAHEIPPGRITIKG